MEDIPCTRMKSNFVPQARRMEGLFVTLKAAHAAFQNVLDEESNAAQVQIAYVIS